MHSDYSATSTVDVAILHQLQSSSFYLFKSVVFSVILMYNTRMYC